jgi:DNA-directed RNA polymerase specialized sigma24 family protein
MISSYHTGTRRPQAVEFDEQLDFAADNQSVSVVEPDAIYQAVRRLSPPLRDKLVAVDVLELSCRQAARARHADRYGHESPLPNSYPSG